jgi:polar amino acid transport system substrate-binding protein
MAIVYGAIKQHNGFIDVFNEVDHGTTIKVCLPIIEAQHTLHDARITHSMPEKGSETILLAEDDVNVRKLIDKVLTSNGYEVIQAEDGNDAIHKFAANSDRIRLILMDIIMPRKNGKDAYDENCRQQSGVKVLFLSGYTADFLKERGVSKEEMEIMIKPIQPLELLRKVRHLLDT